MKDKEREELIRRREFKHVTNRTAFLQSGFSSSQSHLLQSRLVEKDDFYEMLDRLDKLSDRISKIEEKI